MIFTVFVSLLASAINIKTVYAAENSIISTVSAINHTSGLQYELKAAGKDIINQQSCSNDSFEPDNDYLHATTISTDGNPQSHVNTPAAEEDWVKFSAIAGHQYQIGTRLTNDINQGDTAANDTLLYLYGPDGVTQLAFNDDVGDFTWYNGYYHYRESFISWAAPSTGDYFVRELQWGPTLGYTVTDCHTYDMWVIDMTTTPILALSKTSTTVSVTFAGQVVPYQYLLTNNTNTTLKGIVLNDDKTVPSCPQTTLVAGGSMVCTASYTVTQANINTGGFLRNNANARYDPDIVITTYHDIPITQTPAIHVVKNSTTTTITHAGQVVPYAFLVTNTGNVTLTGITVGDPNCDTAPAYQSGDTNTDGKLDLPETWTYTCSHTVTQAEIDVGGNLSNTVTADSNQSGIATDHLDIPITQTYTDTPSNTPTDTPTYTYTPSNTPTHTYTPTPSNTPTDTPTYTFTPSNTPTHTYTPTPSDTPTDTPTYTYTPSDTPTHTFTPTPSDTPTDTPTYTYTPSNTPTAIPTQNPALGIAKSVTETGYSTVGTVLHYSFKVTNTGNVTLSGPFTVSDDKATDEACPLTPTLAPGSFITCSASYSITQADLDSGSVTNIASAHGSFGGSPVDSATDTKTISATQIASLVLTKTGTLNMNVVPPDGVANVGDTITYSFSMQNTGNVTLTNINVSDPRLPALICAIANLAPGVSASCTPSNNEYNLNQTDINNGSVSNTATATGKDPKNNDVNGSDSTTINIPQSPLIGIAKRMVGNPVSVSPGTWDVTFEILVKNYGNVPLSALQVTDNMSLTFPAPTAFTVQSVSSSAFTENWTSPALPTDYNGITNLNLLTGVDTLSIAGQGTITEIVRIVPASNGPFENSAIASGMPPIGSRVFDVSSDGTDPDHTINCSIADICVNDDNNPNNNTKPTPVIFTENLFDPPFGVKSVNSSGLPELAWSMVWINGSNIVAQNAAVSDPIPVGTTYLTGSLSCTGASPLTTTVDCRYEIPTIPYPRGRVVWTGTIGPDFRATDAASANNELIIAFKVTVNSGVDSVQNMATLDADLNGDGDTTDPGEQQVASASSSWTNPPTPPTPTPIPPLTRFIIPETGFAPDQVTLLPPQTTFYTALGDLWLEIPHLGVQMPIVGVPQINGKWDVSWLGSDAGWLNGSAYPTWNGNSVLTGHVTDAVGNPGPFARLNTLMWGDKVIIHISSAQYIFEVRSILQVGPGSSNTMLKHEETPWVTLVTCRGYNITSNSYLYRVLVRAILVDVK